MMNCFDQQAAGDVVSNPRCALLQYKLQVKWKILSEHMQAEGAEREDMTDINNKG